MIYKHGILIGKECVIEDSFEPLMDVLCGYASDCKLKLSGNSSERDSIIVPGAIVEPAKMSNHLVGHAIDVDILDTETHIFWNSEKLLGELTGNVLAFIELVRKHPVLRWGGDFHTRDGVHFDDGLNIHNPEKYQELLKAKEKPMC